MDSVGPWLDPGEVRRLAERLLVGSDAVALPSPEEPYGRQFVGFAGPLAEAPVEVPVERPVGRPAVEQPPVEQPPVEQPPVEQPPVEQPPVEQPPVEQPPVEPQSVDPPPEQPPERQAPEEVAEVAPLPPVASQQAVPEVPCEAPHGPFLQRVQRFRGWLREQFSVRGMFLLDREGKAIFDDGVPENLQALARNLAQASRVTAGAGSNVHVKVGADATLEVIPVDTHYGVIVLGAIVSQAISPRGVALIIDGLGRTAMPPA